MSSRRRPPAVLTALRRAVSWHRRPLAAVAAAIAVLAVISAVSPATPTTVPVVVAAAALPAGTALTPADLRVVAVPTALVPDQAVTDIAAVDGRVLTAAKTAGEILTAMAVVAPRAGDGSGLVTTPIRLADTDVVALLAVGDVVDVVAADPRTGASAVVAENARIVAIPQRAPTGSGPLGTTAGTSEGQLVLVEVEPTVATALATALANGRLTVVWRS